MVEFKIDRETEMPFLMEINARFWGSVLLPLAAGLDLPLIFWKVLNGQAVTSDELAYEAGVIGRYLFGDSKHLAHALKGRPRNWPGEYPGRWEALRDYLALFFDRKSRNLLLTREDPRPFFGRLMEELFG